MEFYIENNEAYLSGVNYNDPEYLVVPSTYYDEDTQETYPVVGIGSYAFQYNSTIVNVQMSSSVRIIKYNAFYGNTHIITVIVGDGVTTIEDNAFADCRVKEVYISNSVINIGSQLFVRNDYIDTVVVDPNNSKYDSRDNCNAIVETATNKLVMACKNSTISPTVTIIGSGAFMYTHDGRSAYDWDLIIPGNVKTIESNAFSWNSDLNTVTFQDGTTTIESESFRLSHNIRNVFISSTINYIGSGAFEGVDNIEVDSNNLIYDSRNNCGCVMETATDTLVIGSRDANIPSDTKIIEDRAFAYCSFRYISSSSYSLPYGLQKIGSYAFNNVGWNYLDTPSSNAELKKLIIPDTVTEIKSYAFASNYVEEIVLPNGITELEIGMFSDSDIRTIKIPESVEKLGYNDVLGVNTNIVDSCANLSRIIVDDNNPYFNSVNDSNCIIETASNKLISGCINTTIPDTVKIIGRYAFYQLRQSGGNIGLKNIVIPSSVECIEEWAFQYCDGIDTLIISGNLSASDKLKLTTLNKGIIILNDDVENNLSFGENCFPFVSTMYLPEVLDTNCYTNVIWSLDSFKHGFCYYGGTNTLPERPSGTSIEYGSKLILKDLRELYWETGTHRLRYSLISNEGKTTRWSESSIYTVE